MVRRRWLAPGAHGQRRAEPLPAVELAELAFYSLVDGGAALARAANSRGC